MLKPPVYLDYNATTPCDERVVKAMMPFFSQHFGNAASRNHIFGWQAEEAVNYAREKLAKMIGADPTEIVFTSGATEADNLALKGILETYGQKGKHIITCSIEHKAVLDACGHLEKQGAEITYVRVKGNGLIDLNELEDAIKPTTVLVAVMYANNEIGTIMPINEIGEITRKKGVLFFTDATQAVGKIPVSVTDGIDLLAFSAHKMYGPKGVGALYVRRKNPRVKLTAQIDGGGHERGRRSGTLNVPAIVGFGKAGEICMETMEEEALRISDLRNKLEESLLTIDDSFVNGIKEHRLPNVTNICFGRGQGEILMRNLGKQVAVSSGSACMSASLEPSYVLKALGLSDENARSSLRFSLGRYTTEEQVAYAVNQFKNAADRLRKMGVQFKEKT